MSGLPCFSASAPTTLGVEIELQVLDTDSYDLAHGADELLRLALRRKIAADIKPEVTRSMIEVSTGICRGYGDVLTQLSEARDWLLECASRQNLRLAGGGTHPFQDWSSRRIFNAPRFQRVSDYFGYLTKQFTVFGQHVHVGCTDGDQAMWLLHALGRFVPHLIVLSASSPFVQGVDTGFHSARLNSIAAFPMAGHAPFARSWAEFDSHFRRLMATGVVESIKDLYWDIRPKPEFGTVEVRVMDTPLTIHRAACIAAFIQVLSRWLLAERPFDISAEDYLVYGFNRFQAARFGLDGTIVDPQSQHRAVISNSVLSLMDRLDPHADDLGAVPAFETIRWWLRGGTATDADWLRATQRREQFLPEVVRLQSERLAG